MRLVITLLITVLLQTAALLSQASLEKEEIELNKSLLAFRQAVTAEEMDLENEWTYILKDMTEKRLLQKIF